MSTIVTYQPKGSAELFEPSVLGAVSFSSMRENNPFAKVYKPKDIVAKWTIKIKQNNANN